MSLRHALILAINTSILAVLFVFTSWLYVSSRAEVEAHVAESLDGAARMTGNLARLREAELSGLAASLAESPLIKGALATQDAETIRDVLKTIAQKNRLPRAALFSGPAERYASRPGKRGGEVFIGRAPAGGLTLTLFDAPTAALLDDWSPITGVRYALGSVDNVPAEDAAVLKAAGPVVSAKNKYYRREARLLDGRLSLGLYALYAPFWRPFEARRDSLVVLGGVLFFCGLLLSLFFADLIEKHSGAARQAPPDWDRLLDEIEKARERRA